jgi:hypothetical protein
MKFHVYLSDTVYDDLDSFHRLNKSNAIREMLKKYTEYLEKNGIKKDEIKKQKRTKQREICMIPSQITKYTKIAVKYQFKNLSEFIYNAYLYNKNLDFYYKLF